jgi:rhodanese-related sulfurtransferase
MYKFVLSLVFITAVLFAKENPMVLQYTGVETVHKHSSDEQSIRIYRNQPKECLSVEISHESVFGNGEENKKIDSKCKKTFITTLGQVQAMNIADGVKTVAEIEVLDFIKNKSSKNPEQYMLIDSRKSIWYEEATIPSAVNLPYTYMEHDKDFQEDYIKMLKLLSIEKRGDKFDFSKAKTLLLFCNGSWCGQSPSAIKILLKMGYPAKKLLWYRGGIESWLMLGFNTIKPK